MRAKAPRRGFVLLTVLWVTVAIAALGVAAMLAVRDAVSTSRNRVSLARAAWGAEGCLAGMVAASDDALAVGGEGSTVWANLDRALAEAPLLQGSGCDLRVRAAGAALDVNTADAEELHRLLRAEGLTDEASDSLIDAVLDWRDADAEPRPRGAERAWYLAAKRLPPRDGSFADVREIALVRGMSLVGGDSLLGTEAGRVPLNRAPRPVLAALPGLDDEAVERISELRTAGAGSIDLAAVAGTLSPAGRDTLNAHYAELSRRVVGEPEAWIVTVQMATGAPPVNAAIEVRIVRIGAHVAIVRRRSWP